MTVRKKYHTKKNGELGLCEAYKERCPNGGVHVLADSVVEARRKYEEEISYQHSLFPTLSQRKNHVFKNRLLDFTRDPDIKYYDHTALIELGSLIIKESNSRLSFNPDSIKRKYFDENLVNEISVENKNILSEIVSTGGNFEGFIDNRQSSSNVSLFIEGTNFLPNSLKKERANEVFVIESEKEENVHGRFLRSNKRKRQGRNIFSRALKIEEVKLTLPNSVDNNDDNFDVRSKYGTVVHEYAHYVHDLNKRRLANDVTHFTSAELLYNVLDGKSERDTLRQIFDKRNDPNESRREGLLGYSTEELFYPGSIAASKKSFDPVLYGSDKTERADDVLHFTMGYWVQQAIVAEEE